jgi:beta-lactam-binding protein with PASTA domain
LKKTKFICNLLFGLAFSVYVNAAENVKVPNIYNTCGESTNKIIKKAGLKPKSIPVHGGGVGGIEWGCAYDQSPKPGIKVKKGSVITYKYGWEAG